MNATMLDLKECFVDLYGTSHSVACQALLSYSSSLPSPDVMDLSIMLRPGKINVSVLIRKKLKNDEGERFFNFFLKLKNKCLGSHQKKIEK